MLKVFIITINCSQNCKKEGINTKIYLGLPRSQANLDILSMPWTEFMWALKQDRGIVVVNYMTL